jgi:hypothetical protein
MPDYRVFPLRTKSSFAPPEVFVASNDAEAFVAAEGFDCPLGYEIWSGPRLVAVVQRARQQGEHANEWIGAPRSSAAAGVSWRERT